MSLTCEVCGVETKAETNLFLNGKALCSQECLEKYANRVDN